MIRVEPSLFICSNHLNRLASNSDYGQRFAHCAVGLLAHNYPDGRRAEQPLLVRIPAQPFKQ